MITTVTAQSDEPTSAEQPEVFGIDRPSTELDGLLRDWANFRRGWHA
jgi:hypothetical protein